MNVIRAYWRHFCIIFVALCVAAVLAVPFAARHSRKDYIPVVMILAEEDTGLYSSPEAQWDPMYTMLKSSIESELTVVVSTPVLYWLTQRTAEGRNPGFNWAKSVINAYDVRVTKSDKFALLIPKKYAESLDSIGFNEDYLNDPIATSKKLKAHFAHKRYAHQAVNPDELALLLRQSTFNNPTLPQYWYITGHGLDTIDETNHEWHNAIMAQMPIYNMVNVLQILNNTNTQMVYLLSCYSAGSNLLQLQHLLAGTVTDELCKPITPLRYPILIQCSMDTASTRIAGRYFSLTELFEAMAQWRNRSTPDFSSLSVALSPMYEKTPRDERFTNYPIVRLPGTASHFKALELSSTKVIQYPVANPQTIETSQDIDVIQVYPANAQQLTIAMQHRVLPNLMSRVPGNAHHFIGTINVKGLGSIDTIIQNVFLNGLTDNGEIFYGVADKAWFIDTVISNKKTIATGLVVYRGSIKKAKSVAIATYKAADGNYYRLNCPLDMYGSIQKAQRINEKQYTEIIKRIYWETLPEDDALTESTDGTETRKNHDKLLENFGAALSLTLTPPVAKDMIEQDLQEIESGRLAKKNFIYYATHAHNKELVQAIIDATCEERIFTNDDCMLLLVNLLDDEYPFLALEQINTLATHDNPAVTPIATASVSYIVQQDRHKQLLQANFPALKQLELTQQNYSDRIII